jgi:hypothetical protein
MQDTLGRSSPGPSDLDRLTSFLGSKSISDLGALTRNRGLLREVAMRLGKTETDITVLVFRMSKRDVVALEKAGFKNTAAAKREYFIDA